MHVVAKRERQAKTRAQIRSGLTIKTDDLSREVTLHVTMDGTMTIGPLVIQRDRARSGDWRDVAIDKLLEAETSGDIDDVVSLLRSYRNDALAVEPDSEYMSLPVFSVDTYVQARLIRTSVCRLEHGQCAQLAPNERWYRVPNFGSLEDLYALTAKIRTLWDVIRLRHVPGESRRDEY